MKADRDLSLKEVARELGFSTRTISRARDAGRIKGYRASGERGNWRFTRAEVARVRGADLSAEPRS